MCVVVVPITWYIFYIYICLPRALIIFMSGAVRAAARLCSYIYYIIYKQVYIDSETEKEIERARKRWKGITLYNCSADIPLLHRIALTCIDTFPVKLSRVKGAAPADSAHIYVCLNRLYTPTYK